MDEDREAEHEPGAEAREPALHGAAELVLGLPLFIHGYIEPTDRLTVIVLPTQFGAIETMVLIAGQRD